MNKIINIKDRDISVIDNSNYIFYADATVFKESPFNGLCGKWIVTVGDAEKAVKSCMLAVALGIVLEAKHSKDNKGTCFFYCNADETERHKKVIAYLLSQNLIPKTKSGKYFNIAYKLDAQTIAGEYGKGAALFHLSDFINLETGKAKIQCQT